MYSRLMQLFFNCILFYLIASNNKFATKLRSMLSEHFLSPIKPVLQCCNVVFILKCHSNSLLNPDMAPHGADAF